MPFKNYENVIKVHVLIENVSSRTYSLGVPNGRLSKKKIIRSILAAQQITKVDGDYKVDNLYQPTLQVQIVAVNDPANAYQYVINITLASLPQQIEYKSYTCLWNNKHLSDVVLCVSGREIYTHKVILSLKSPVFKSLFANGICKSRYTKVIVKNISYDTIHGILYYMYTGQIKGVGLLSKKEAYVKCSNLLKADKIYRVEGLKETCEEQLMLQITSLNVIDCLILAETCNASTLKQRAIDYIVQNVNTKEISKLLKSESFLRLHSLVLVEIIRAMVAGNTGKS